MAIRSNRLKRQVWAGALLGALAAFVVGMTGQWLLWMQTGPRVESTGATQGVDLWSYYSMARAVWRSPNGFTYSYPYEFYWATPPVIFQLPITVLAWLGRITGLPSAFEIGRVAGGAGAGAAIGAIGTLFPSGFWRRWFYIAAVLGGGFFGVAAMHKAVETAGWPGLTEPEQYLPHVQGNLIWWLPYPAANLRLPLECIYHALVIGALACVVRRRHGVAWVLGAVIWMSNPFAAIALHSAVVPWYLWRTLETTGSRRTRMGGWLVAWFVVNGIAAAYYGWFLNRWPLLRELHRLYGIQFVPALDWHRLFLLNMPYGAGLIASIVSRPIRNAIWGRPVWRLFAILAVAHLILIQQSFFLGERSMQAYHYNRGYLHLALVVVSWRVLLLILYKRNCLSLRTFRGVLKPWDIRPARCRIAAVVVTVIVSVTCLDQLFFAKYAASLQNYSGIIGSEYATLVRAIPSSPAPAVVLTEPVLLKGSYVTAFSPHVGYMAEETMIVPFPHYREQLLEKAMAGKASSVAALGIGYAILSVENTAWIESLNAQGWKKIEKNRDLLLLAAPEKTLTQRR